MLRLKFPVFFTEKESESAFLERTLILVFAKMKKSPISCSQSIVYLAVKGFFYSPLENLSFAHRFDYDIA